LTTSDVTQGPSKGSLLLVGGALKDPAILDRFMDLAGGYNAPIAIIPTAGGALHYDQYDWPVKAFREAGATNVTLHHTYNPDIANTEDFATPLREARGVWFIGGNQWRLADAYLNTLTHEAFGTVLDCGGVLGGSSAGAALLGSYLVRGDTKSGDILMGDHEVGFGFLRQIALDQHLLKQNRQFDLVRVVEAHPELLGIGLDEDTAIVVVGDDFEVIGQSYVAIYDTDSDRPFYLLSPGDCFNLKTRQATRPTLIQKPLELANGR
jgi:cyanophycinase